MKRLRVQYRVMMVASVLAVLPLCARDCPKQPKSKDALVEVERAWASAYDKRDVPAMACLLAPEYRHTGYDGKVLERAAVLTRLAGLSKEGATHHELQEVKPVLFGDVAVVYGTNRASEPDGSVFVDVRFTDVFVYRARRWLAVAEHESRVQGSGPGAN